MSTKNKVGWVLFGVLVVVAITSMITYWGWPQVVLSLAITTFFLGLICLIIWLLDL